MMPDRTSGARPAEAMPPHDVRHKAHSGPRTIVHALESESSLSFKETSVCECGRDGPIPLARRGMVPV